MANRYMKRYAILLLLGKCNAKQPLGIDSCLLGWILLNTKQAKRTVGKDV
jgi:hypothetical protein